MKYTLDSTIDDLLSTERGRKVTFTHAPRLESDSSRWSLGATTLRQAAKDGMAGITERAAAAIVRDMDRPLHQVLPRAARRRSLDAIDRASFRPGAGPMSGRFTAVRLSRGGFDHPKGAETISLDGDWELVEGGLEKERRGGSWPDAIPARVPGSVHSALVAAGRIPDPSVGVNQKNARQESFKTWWMRRHFSLPAGMTKARLVFHGICNTCSIWLNGHLLGEHEGMFGGPDDEVSSLLKAENTLLVRLDPVPFAPGGAYPENNASWKKTVVFNNVYGWHYSNVQPLGIWRSVELRPSAAVELGTPFLATRNAAKGLLDLSVTLYGPGKGWAAVVNASIEPLSFQGASWHLSRNVECRGKTRHLRLRFQVPQPRLWWPVDLGQPELYTMQLSVVPLSGEPADSCRFTFGIRTVEMSPLPDGPRPDKFDWTFIINGVPRFAKGSGWCTMDALMDFPRARYERFLELARQEHVQMLRCWGSGMPETDDFYDLCDRKGIMVIQEWPTAWNSHRDQPFPVLEETVRRNTLRLRNHASLVMWGGGNESSVPFGKAIDMMGRLSVELDGTRPFHRGEPFGGSQHNYDCYWGRQHLDRTLSVEADFLGEFGLASMPILESVNRYLPPAEKDVFPPPRNGTLVYHTPIFGTADDWSRLSQFSGYFVDPEGTLADFITGSQLAQALGVRHVLERARVRWPECAGALYYKMNDNFPAASWASVDWYGAPKIGHYVFQDALSPLRAIVLFRSINLSGSDSLLPVFLLDDENTCASRSWKVIVRVYDGDLNRIAGQEFEGHGSIQAPARLGDLPLGWKQAESAPLLFVAEVCAGSSVLDRSFYWMNFQARKGCLFRLPGTTLQLHVVPGESGGAAIVRNSGGLPAVAVQVSCAGHMDSFTISDNFFWLDPGEERELQVDRVDGLSVSAWNA